MKLTDVNLQAFSMSLCHQMNVDTKSDKRVKGVYALVLQGHEVMKETGLLFEEMDDVWCEVFAHCLAELLAAKGMPLPDSKKGNIILMVKNAASNIRNQKAFYLATTMADVFELRKVKEELGL
jgi:hypothetical protein